jgi:hypothetical protein
MLPFGSRNPPWRKDTVMKTSGKYAAALAGCILCATGLGYYLFAAETKEITLTGGAIWNGNKHRADVKATLTPTGNKQYDVVYNFTWEGSHQTWKGTMKGELKNGVVSGTGATPDGKRTFIFQARATSGVLSGKHYETTSGKPKLTGDIGLKP